MARYFRRRKYCRFTAEGVEEIDYKDLATLKNYISETGKSCRVASPAPNPITRDSWRRPSNGLGIWRCCLIPIVTDRVGYIGMPAASPRTAVS